MMKIIGLKKNYVRIILEKLVSDQLVKNFPEHYGTPICITLFTRARYRNQLHAVTTLIF
jgi:hypothetical protein